MKGKIIVTNANPSESNLTTAKALKNPDFSYTGILQGAGFGKSEDYIFLQVFIGLEMPVLIQDGKVRTVTNVFNVNLTDTEIKFTYKPSNGAPTYNDEVQIKFTKKDGSNGISNKVLLQVGYNVPPFF